MVQAHQEHLAQSVLAASIEYRDEPGEQSAPLDGTNASWTITRA